MTMAIALFKTDSFYEKIAPLTVSVVVSAVIVCGLFIFRYADAKSYKGCKSVLNPKFRTFLFMFLAVGSGCFVTRDGDRFAP